MITIITILINTVDFMTIIARMASLQYKGKHFCGGSLVFALFVVFIADPSYDTDDNDDDNHHFDDNTDDRSPEVNTVVCCHCDNDE